MSSPFFSIVITCFNYGRYLSGAIESALAQTYLHREIIVVDDGSTDDTPDVAARYAEHVQVIRQANAGHIAAYLTGFAASRGGVIIFLDADDLLEPTCLSEVANVWTERCAKVQYDLNIIDAEGRSLGRTHSSFDAPYSPEEVARSFAATKTYRWPVTTGNAYARSFVEKMVPLDRRLGPDGILNTAAPLYGEVRTVSKVLGSYRLHGGNIWASGANDMRRLGERIDARRAELAIMESHAQRLGVSLSAEDSLDHELPFLTYRLLAKRLGISYSESERERSAQLLFKTVRHLQGKQYGLRARAVHLSWALAVAASPKPVVEALARLRYARGGAREGLATRIQGWRLRTRETLGPLRAITEGS